jgi:hypothetical protein
LPGGTTSFDGFMAFIALYIFDFLFRGLSLDEIEELEIVDSEAVELSVSEGVSENSSELVSFLLDLERDFFVFLGELSITEDFLSLPERLFVPLLLTSRLVHEGDGL